MFKNIYTLVSCCFFLSYGNFLFAMEKEEFNVLLIGRPENGGVNIETASKAFPSINKNSVLFLAPDSVGPASIVAYFPCEIPKNNPQSYKVVCLEQGMLNEVALNSKHDSPLLLPSCNILSNNTSLPSPLELEKELKKLSNEYHDYWQNWTELKKERKTLEEQIIEKAIEHKIIYKTIEFENPYYSICMSDKNTYADSVIVDRLFERREHLKNHNLFSPLEIFENDLKDLDLKIETVRQKMGEISKKQNELHKITEELEEEKNILLEKFSSVTNPSTTIKPPSEIESNIILFLQKAWDLVDFEGQMIVFSQNAQVDEGNELAEGISKTFLEKHLAGQFIIEEISFPGQQYEGQIYYSNPVIPANKNIMGWSGSRNPGSYFLITKYK